ncbi:ribosomal protection-like ABC-F family protein [Heyndrickxia acidicola]|uniref:ABC-F family ATP-binding cassette domain-containing protein n=2 Tax=Heyndrickxia acidicola TaxID=209389 RepID=A0ABU6MGH9_9BACI|nr:ABC-F family ATP-binding cassette domain-containing protein [Heyndrickxia acidicola]MED1203600.1 ABC-F family ATP-binding cassette domain-containing protein [Heyndrickxia acidicola]
MYIKTESIKKMIGGNIIFEQLTMELQQGEIVGLIGRNGCGKTTLLQLLSEKETVDLGRIVKKKGISIGHLHQIPMYPATYTGIDVLYEAFNQVLSIQQELKLYEQQLTEAKGEKLEEALQRYGELQEHFMQLGGYEIDAKVQKVIQGLNLNGFVHTLFTDLSGGEQTKLMLGQILLREPDVLLLDEPTNHLDMHAIEWLEEYIESFSGAALIVSHDRHFLNVVANRIIELEDEELTQYVGNYDDYVSEKEARLLLEFQQYEEQQKKIKKMKEAIKRLKQWANEANPPSDSLHRRAKNMEKALARIELVRKPIVSKKMSLAFDTATRSGKEVVVLDNMSKRFNQPLLKHVSLTIRWQDRLAIVGANGTGKSTLMEIMMGKIQPDEGVCRLGSNVKVGYISQKFTYDNSRIRVVDAFRESVSMSEGEARNILANFLFYGYDVFKKVSDLSGGEKMRLRLAQLMHEEVNVLLLDEPTNHLDIDSKEVLEETLQQFEGTIIAISHDRYFLNKLFSKIAWIEQQQVQLYEGNYDWALTRRKTSITEIAPSVKQKPIQKVCSRVESRDFEKEIASLENKLICIQTQIDEETHWSKYEMLLQEQQHLQSDLENCYEEWLQYQEDSEM